MIRGPIHVGYPDSPPSQAPIPSPWMEAYNNNKDPLRLPSSGKKKKNLIYLWIYVAIIDLSQASEFNLGCLRQKERKRTKD